MRSHGPNHQPHAVPGTGVLPPLRCGGDDDVSLGLVEFLCWRPMVWWLLGAHLVGVVAAGLAGRRSMATGLVAAAVAPAATTVWAVARLLGDDEPVVGEVRWVEGLDLALRFRIDALALLMTLLVSGIGVLVFVYAVGYFSPDADGGTRFPPALLAFSVSMLGLVWADSIWTLFIFWEFTSITSFVLIGHKHVDVAVRTAARRALLITGAGGLVLLAGLVLLGNEAGTSTITELQPTSGSSAALAAVVDPDRGRHQVGAVPLSRVATGSHGRTDTGQRIPPLGHDGESRCAPGRGHGPGVRRRRRVEGRRFRVRRCVDAVGGRSVPFATATPS